MHAYKYFSKEIDRENGILAFPARMARQFVPQHHETQSENKKRAIYVSEKDPGKLFLAVNLKPGAKKNSITGKR